MKKNKSTLPKRILVLGSGELGKEFVISAKRLGNYVIAVDRYAGAPAMQVADAFEVISMLDAQALDSIVKKYRPDFLVPEIEAIRTEKLQEFENEGITVVPTARAAHLTMNRDAIREIASKKLGLRTARYRYAESKAELREIAMTLGLPLVVKPVMSSSGKGQSVVTKLDEVEAAWTTAKQGMRGDTLKVIAEEFISFDLEITLLTIKQHNAPTLFVAPIGHRQERGDYQESWLPAKIKPRQLLQAKRMAKTITDELGGAGLFGVEFFVTKNEVIFSELSPRPHDTGMVTLISQNLSEFDLHARAILGLPIPKIEYFGPSASAVLLADRCSTKIQYEGVEKALAFPNTEVRIFGKNDSREYRRMGVALARGSSVIKARKLAERVAGLIKIKYEG